MENILQENPKESSAKIDPTLQFINNINKDDDLLEKQNFKKLLEIYRKYLADCKFIERIVPRQLKTQKDIVQILNVKEGRQMAYDYKTLNKALLTPIWDLLDRRGKCWRAVFCFFLAEVFDCKKYVQLHMIINLAALCELIHNGSLIVDDIEDSRRNKDCIHRIYGIDVSINAGNFMYYIGVNAITKSKIIDDKMKFQLLNIYIQEMQNIHFGQGWDIVWGHIKKIEEMPSEKDYQFMCTNKTGVLIKMATKFVLTYLKIDQKIIDVVEQLAESMGVAFQIQDDLINLESKEYSKARGQKGEDIYEGKYTLMVIHSLKNSSQEDSKRLFEILQMHTRNPELIDEAIGLMKKSKSLEYAKEREHEILQAAWQKACKFLPNNKGKDKMKNMSEFFIKRNL